MRKQQGFSLIEIAIVLLVIVLITGSTLRGSEMIYQAKIDNLKKQYDEISSLIMTYYSNYNYLPGDDPNAGERRYDNNSSYNGNGNHIIDGSYASVRDQDESRKIWGHLRTEGFDSRDSKDLSNPTNVFGGIVGISGQKINGKNLDVYIVFTKVPKDILEQLQKKLTNNITPIASYRSNGVPDASWRICTNKKPTPLPPYIKKVDIAITYTPICN